MRRWSRWVHCLEYLWKAAFCFHAADDPAAEDWVVVQALALLAGRAAEVAGQIQAQADTEDLDGERRRRAEACAAEAPSHLRAHPDEIKVTLPAAYLYCRQREIIDVLVDLLITTVRRINARAHSLRASHKILTCAIGARE